MKLIGIGGTNGSGKDTIGQILADKYSWRYISISDFLREELQKRNLPMERENLRQVSAEWRRRYGLGVFVEKAHNDYLEQKEKYNGLAVGSLRNPGEADKVHELGGLVVWVDAEPKIRYERIYSRKRSTEDDKTFEQFLAEEQAEMESADDKSALNMSGVKAKADIFIDNNGDMTNFEIEVSKKLRKLLK